MVRELARRLVAVTMVGVLATACSGVLGQSPPITAPATNPIPNHISRL